MKFKAIIFDFDGTLADTLPDLAAAGNFALQQFGHPTHDVSAYRYFVGEGVARLMENILPPDHRTEKEIKDLRAVYKQYYEEHSAVYTSPYEGICEALDALCAENIPLCVLSNKDDADTKALTKHYFGDRFRIIYGVREGFPRKPDPTVCLSIAKELRVSPADMLFVGDSKFDIKTGKNAGMKTCGVLWGFRDRDELEAEGADYIIAHPSEIMSL